MGNYPLQIWNNFLTNFTTNEISGKSGIYFHWNNKNLKTSDTRNVKKIPVNCCDGPPLTIWWTWSNFVDVLFSWISRKFHFLQNWSISFCIFYRGTFPLLRHYYTPNKTWQQWLSGGQRVLGSIHIQLRKGILYFSKELWDTLYVITFSRLSTSSHDLWTTIWDVLLNS